MEQKAEELYLVDVDWDVYGDVYQVSKSEAGY